MLGPDAGVLGFPKAGRGFDDLLPMPADIDADQDAVAVWDDSTGSVRRTSVAELRGLAAWDLLATATASSTGNIFFDFTDWTNSGYAAYCLVFSNVAPATDGAVPWLRTSPNGVSVDAGASDYEWVTWFTSISGSTGAQTDAADSEIEIFPPGVGNAANEFLNGWVWILDPSASAHTALNWFASGKNLNGNLINETGSGQRLSAAAVNGINFQFSTGNIASGELRLYGVKDTVP